jgi:Gluconate 2-dehydrogenase subunit 3
MSGEYSAIDRREALQRLAIGVGAMVVVPPGMPPHPVHRHLRAADAIADAHAQANAAEYAPTFVDAHQLATVRALAEAIVPGSTEARSAEFIDQLLAVSTPDEGRTFLQALGAFERLAMEHARMSWQQLTEQQQYDLLTLASTAQPGGSSEKSSTDPRVTMRDHFEHLKGWIVGAYYSSERGMRELGWTGNIIFPAFPGCEHSEGHA